MATITGGQTLICSGSVTFSATGFPTNGQWNASTNLILSNQSTNSAMVTVSGQGEAWIQILDGNGQQDGPNAYKRLWLGTPTVIINGPTSTPNGQYADYYANIPAEAGVGSTGYQWTLSPQLNNNLYGANSYNLSIAFYTAGTYQLVCRATNSCGTGGYTTMNGIVVY